MSITFTINAGDKSLWLPVLVRYKINSPLSISYTRSQSGAIWHSLLPYCLFCCHGKKVVMSNPKSEIKSRNCFVTSVSILIVMFVVATLSSPFKYYILHFPYVNTLWSHCTFTCPFTVVYRIHTTRNATSMPVIHI